MTQHTTSYNTRFFSFPSQYGRHNLTRTKQKTLFELLRLRKFNQPKHFALSYYGPQAGRRAAQACRVSPDTRCRQ